MTWLFGLIVSAMVWTLVRMVMYNAFSNRRLTMRRAQGNDLIEVAGQIVGETEKAFRFFDGKETVWLPKSLCEWDSEDKAMTMPEWIAMEKGLI